MHPECTPSVKPSGERHPRDGKPGERPSQGSLGRHPAPSTPRSSLLRLGPGQARLLPGAAPPRPGSRGPAPLARLPAAPPARLRAIGAHWWREARGTAVFEAPCGSRPSPSQRTQPAASSQGAAPALWADTSGWGCVSSTFDCNLPLVYLRGREATREGGGGVELGGRPLEELQQPKLSLCWNLKPTCSFRSRPTGVRNLEFPCRAGAGSCLLYIWSLWTPCIPPPLSGVPTHRPHHPSTFRHCLLLGRECCVTLHKLPNLSEPCFLCLS